MQGWTFYKSRTFGYEHLLHSDGLFHIRVYSAKHLVDTWLVEFEPVRIVLIERGGVKYAGIVDHRMRFAIKIFPGHRRPGFDRERHRRKHEILDNNRIDVLGLRDSEAESQPRHKHPGAEGNDDGAARDSLEHKWVLLASGI